MSPYIWMPPIHTQHKEGMLCQTKGVFIFHLYIWMPPVCLDVPCMFRCPISLDTPHVCLNAPICLDGSLYVWMPPYVLTPPCLHSPICLGAPVFGHPSVWLDAPTCLDTPVCLDALHMFGCPLYVWMLPNVWWHPKV